jgi:hypothetical protein
LQASKEELIAQEETRPHAHFPVATAFRLSHPAVRRFGCFFHRVFPHFFLFPCG